ncbi:major facilitator superfamily domain-containing protein [Stachybotrys elegans]|uniref:Major facilitator superfamily domain-containing protein n=1 Tax=Stachybotrys elegans TaxID=80388 RepID=A0A8K0SXB8_9HYPO|nr:major facilitator superfamily domain-containing protein [Stachybotrys elegans]
MASSPASNRLSQCETFKHTPGSVYLVSEAGVMLKLPIPSDSPQDPLTWSYSKRFLALSALVLYASTAHFEINISGVITEPVDREFSKDSKHVDSEAISAAMTLGPALGYLLAVPLATAMGRKPVLVASATITCLSTLWAAICGSFEQMLAAVGFQSIAAGASISVSTLVLIDCTFIHERPLVIALHWSILGVLSRVGMIGLPCLMSSETSWRHIYVVWLVVSTISLLLLVVLLPETFFLRPPVALDGRVLIQTASEKVLVYREEEFAGPRNEAETQSLTINWKSLLATYMQMLLCLLNPMVLWVGLLTATNLSGVVFLVSTQLDTLIEQKGQNPAIVSNLLGASGIIGAILVFPLTGPVMTWFTRTQALRSGGVRHAEVYLFSFSIPIFTGFLSVLINGLTIHYSWPPFFIYFSTTLIIFSYLSANVAFTIWITEAFPKWAAPALAVQLMMGNIVSFGIANGILACLNGRYILTATIILCVTNAVLGFLVVPAVFWGREVRQFIHGYWGRSERGALRPQ